MVMLLLSTVTFAVLPGDDATVVGRRFSRPYSNGVNAINLLSLKEQANGIRTVNRADMMQIRRI